MVLLTYPYPDNYKQQHQTIMKGEQFKSHFLNSSNSPINISHQKNSFPFSNSFNIENQSNIRMKTVNTSLNLDTRCEDDFKTNDYENRESLKINHSEGIISDKLEERGSLESNLKRQLNMTDKKENNFVEKCKSYKKRILDRYKTEDIQNNHLIVNKNNEIPHNMRKINNQNELYNFQSNFTEIESENPYYFKKENNNNLDLVTKKEKNINFSDKHNQSIQDKIAHYVKSTINSGEINSAELEKEILNCINRNYHNYQLNKLASEQIYNKDHNSSTVDNQKSENVSSIIYKKQNIELINNQEKHLNLLNEEIDKQSYDQSKTEILKNYKYKPNLVNYLSHIHLTVLDLLTESKTYLYSPAKSDTKEMDLVKKTLDMSKIYSNLKNLSSYNNLNNKQNNNNLSNTKLMIIRQLSSDEQNKDSLQNIPNPNLKHRENIKLPFLSKNQFNIKEDPFFKLLNEKYFIEQFDAKEKNSFPHNKSNNINIVKSFSPTLNETVNVKNHLENDINSHSRERYNNSRNYKASNSNINLSNYLSGDIIESNYLESNILNDNNPSNLVNPSVFSDSLLYKHYFIPSSNSCNINETDAIFNNQQNILPDNETALDLSNKSSNSKLTSETKISTPSYLKINSSEENNIIVRNQVNKNMMYLNESETCLNTGELKINNTNINSLLNTNNYINILKEDSSKINSSRSFIHHNENIIVPTISNDDLISKLNDYTASSYNTSFINCNSIIKNNSKNLCDFDEKLTKNHFVLGENNPIHSLTQLNKNIILDTLLDNDAMNDMEKSIRKTSNTNVKNFYPCNRNNVDNKSKINLSEIIESESSRIHLLNQINEKIISHELLNYQNNNFRQQRIGNIDTCVDNLKNIYLSNTNSILKNDKKYDKTDYSIKKLKNIYVNNGKADPLIELLTNKYIFRPQEITNSIGTDKRNYIITENKEEIMLDEDFMVSSAEIKRQPRKRKGSLNYLWEFLLKLLTNPVYNPSCINWTDESKGIFKLNNTKKVSALWGNSKGKSSMSYETMGRALRYYYTRGILNRIPGQRLVYQFNHLSNNEAVSASK